METYNVPLLGSNRNCIKKPNHEKKEKEMDRVKAAAKTLLQSLTRRAKPVAFADLNHVEPVSRGFGWERWTSQWLYETVGLFNSYRLRTDLRYA